MTEIFKDTDDFEIYYKDTVETFSKYLVPFANHYQEESTLDVFLVKNTLVLKYLVAYVYKPMNSIRVEVSDYQFTLFEILFT